MTAHLLIMYPHPKDAKKFDRAYREEHLPYAGPRLKGATGVLTKRVVGPSFAPPPFYLISDVSFPTIEALKTTAASSGKEALDHAASISSGGAPTILVVTDDA
ncbi:MAG TPA: EthD family reductase [Stellaceae bacterium]|nr:EthD family reductase [Stellaceae bacterium]